MFKVTWQKKKVPVDETESQPDQYEIHMKDETTTPNNTLLDKEKQPVFK
jgi:hypothetical protein